jgi:hypothetical protein
MATTQTFDSTDRISDSAGGLTASPSRQAFQILRLAYTVAPIVAGLDKFFNLLVTGTSTSRAWSTRLLGGNVHTCSCRASASSRSWPGIGVALRPRLFSYVVAGWLAGIILNCSPSPATTTSRCVTWDSRSVQLALARLSVESLGALNKRRPDRQDCRTRRLPASSPSPLREVSMNLRSVRTAAFAALAGALLLIAPATAAPAHGNKHKGPPEADLRMAMRSLGRTTSTGRGLVIVSTLPRPARLVTPRAARLLQTSRPSATR